MTKQLDLTDFPRAIKDWAEGLIHALENECEERRADDEDREVDTN